jgi:anti-sigma factor RsiW
MSLSPRPIQEEELHAFVDGRLDAERHAEVARLVEADPSLRARLEDWEQQADLLRSAFAFKAREPVPPQLNIGRLIETGASRRTASWRIVAGLLIALSLGAAGGWIARDHQTRDDMEWLTMQATAAHRVFVSDNERPVELGPDSQASLVTWIADRLGRRVDVPDLTHFGYHFIGGRVLAAVGGPAAMLMYGDSSGNRVTVYVQPMATDATLPMRLVTRNTVAGYAWINQQIGYGVMSNGTDAGPALHAVANLVRDDMRS